jgi:hypothetical protein
MRCKRCGMGEVKECSACAKLPRCRHPRSVVRLDRCQACGALFGSLFGEGWIGGVGAPIYSVHTRLGHAGDYVSLTVARSIAKRVDGIIYGPMGEMLQFNGIGRAAR